MCVFVDWYVLYIYLWFVIFNPFIIGWLEYCLFFQIDHPAGFQAKPNLSGIFAHVEHILQMLYGNISQMIAILLGQLETLLTYQVRIGQVATVFGRRVELECIYWWNSVSRYWFATLEKAQWIAHGIDTIQIVIFGCDYAAIALDCSQCQFGCNPLDFDVYLRFEYISTLKFQRTEIVDEDDLLACLNLNLLRQSIGCHTVFLMVLVQLFSYCI